MRSGLMSRWLGQPKWKVVSKQLKISLERHWLTGDLKVRCEVCLRYFTKSLRATVFMQTVYSTVVRGYS